jgi:hypothetical protein
MNEGDQRWAEETLAGLLRTAGMLPRGTYGPAEICAILGFSESTIWRLLRVFDLDPETGTPKHPQSLASIRLANKRFVPHEELVAFLARNRSSAAHVPYQPVPPRHKKAATASAERSPE